MTEPQKTGFNIQQSVDELIEALKTAGADEQGSELESVANGVYTTGTEFQVELRGVLKRISKTRQARELGLDAKISGIVKQIEKNLNMRAPFKFFD